MISYQFPLQPDRERCVRTLTTAAKETCLTLVCWFTDHDANKSYQYKLRLVCHVNLYTNITPDIGVLTVFQHKQSRVNGYDWRTMCTCISTSSCLCTFIAISLM